MRKRLLFVGLCTAAVLSFMACAGAESNGKEVETQKVEDAVRSMEEAATQEPETEDEIHYTVYVYNEDGTIKRSYNDVFDVTVLRNGVVQISMYKEGKETRLLVNEQVEIVQKRVTNIVQKTKNREEVREDHGYVFAGMRCMQTEKFIAELKSAACD